MISDRVQEIINTYLENLIIQYKNKPQSRAITTAFLNTLLSDVFFEIEEAYNVDTAIGKQLDVLGKYAGIDRFYSGGSLSDNDFRIVIKLKIIQNNSSHSKKSIDDSFFAFFQNGIVAITENKMDLNYILINSDIASIVSVLKEKNVLPRPMGVDLNFIISPTQDTKLFTFFSQDEKTLAPFEGGFNVEGGENKTEFLREDLILQ